MFVAVVPPAEVLTHLDAALATHRSQPGTPRWTPAEHWHLTLAFLPAVPAERVDELVERLGRAASRGTALTATVVGVGAFPRPTYARVLWAGVQVDGDGLRRLASAARAAARRTGVEVAEGPFTPHLTVARLPRAGDATLWLQALDGYRGPTWTVDEIRLVASRLGQGDAGRPRYETVAALPLQPG